MRWVVLAMLAGAAIASYLTRTSISTAATTIQADLRLSDIEMGDVLAGFFFGYIWLQIPGGWLGGRFGARATLAVFSLLWSAATLASARAQTYSVLSWSRIAMGAAQSGLFAVTVKALADWFPQSRRGTASAVITGSMSIGAVIASGLTVRLIGPLGWRTTFDLYAWIGILWAVAFYLGFRNRPDEHWAVNAAECNLIRGEPAALASASSAPDAKPESFVVVLRTMALSRGLWALCVQAFFRAFGYALFITWFPAYLEQGYHVQLASAGDLSMLPLAGVVAGSFLGGPIVDAILARTGSKWLSRSGVSAAALGLCAVAVLSAALVPDPRGAVGVIAVGAFLSGLAGPTTWAATMDISGRHTAFVFAIMNMAGNVGAVACPIVVGHLIDHIHKTHGDWNSVLYLFAAIYLAGAVAWLALDPNRSAVEPPGKGAGEKEALV